MFSSYLSSLPENPGGVSAALSPDALERLPQPVRSLYLERARHAADAPLTQLLASQWLAFARTGDRAVYETPYFERRRRLNDLVCGLLLRHTSEQLDAVVHAECVAVRVHTACGSRGAQGGHCEGCAFAGLFSGRIRRGRLLRRGGAVLRPCRAVPVRMP